MYTSYENSKVLEKLKMQKSYFVEIRIMLMFQSFLQEQTFLTHSFGVSVTAKEIILVKANR